MTISSTLTKRGPVLFPAFTGERIYMAEVRAEHFIPGAMPPQLARWAGTMAAMLAGIPTIPPVMYLMVDQRVCQKGEPHRRPGAHVDGYWNPGRGWGEDTGWIARPEPRGHSGSPPGHTASPPAPKPKPKPKPRPPSHDSGTHSALSNWSTATFTAPEALLLASDVPACRAFLGTAPTGVGHMGDCSALDLSGLEILPLEAGYCYAGTVGTLHESLPVPWDCQRTVVRLNIPGVAP